MKKTMLAILLVCCLCTACTAAPVQTTECPTTEAAATTGDLSPRVISPLPCTVDLNQLHHCTLDVSLEENALIWDDTGKAAMQLTVHTYDLYDLVDISRMQAGDTISINRQDLLITSVEETAYGSVLINGGPENGGHELRTEGGGVYFETGFSDVKSYYEIGSITLPLSPDFVYVDASDPDSGESVWSVEEFAAMYEGIAFYFQPGSTSVVVENGVITSLIRIYVP